MNRKQLLFAVGRPFSPLYSMLMGMREGLYQKGIFKTYQLEVPVISVGNLTLGGTGKTPMVQYVARLLQKQGIRSAIISRGYGGKAKKAVNIVSDENQFYLDAEMAGDEPRFLAETLPGIPVLTGVVRKLPALKAIEMGAEVLILDDGFQHIQVKRDINLVLFNADALAGNSRVFPGGDLREPVAALHRATDFILTGVNDENRQRALQFGALLEKKFPAVPINFSGYTPESLVKLNTDGKIVAADSSEPLEQKCYGFCGIARPDSFRQTLDRQQYNIVGFSSFSDHQKYATASLQRIADKAKELGAGILLTTEKDLIKLSRLFSDIDLPIFAQRMQIDVSSEFDAFILETLASSTK